MKMPKNLMITGGRIIDPATGIDAETTLYIGRDGRIAAVGEKPLDFIPEQELHVPDHIVCPGFIDLSARLREPGFEYKGNIATETRAAASAGITTLCCPPDTNPPVDSPAVAELIREQVHEAGDTCRVMVIGAMTLDLAGKQLSEYHALKEADCIGLSNANQPIQNNLILRRALEYAATFDLLVFIRPQDYELANGGCMHEGETSVRLGLPGIPACAETVAVAQYLELIQQTGVRAHFSQLSCARSVTLISRSQYMDTPVTADVAAHQLFFTDADADGFNAMLHLNPPLRTAEDRDGLIEGLNREVISAICSDHQPHEDSAKQNPFGETEYGISSLQTLLPITLHLVENDKLSLHQAITSLTSGPAAILDVDLGSLQPGLPADICIFDPEQEWQPDTDSWYSQGQNTPFWGKTLKGRVNCTIVEGRPVFIHPDSDLSLKDWGERPLSESENLY